MDPHQLRTFVTVARLGSFSAAARELSYTQSAVSQQVAALEADLGMTLLRRRPVAPTEAGARLVEHATSILLRLDLARADLLRRDTMQPDRLVVGLTPLALSPAIAAQLAELARRRPRLDTALRILGRGDVVPGLGRGDLDLGLLDGIVAPTDPLTLGDAGPWLAERVAEHDLVLAVPVDHPLRERVGVRLDDLTDARWIDAPDAGGPLFRLRAATGIDGFPARLRYDGTDVAGLLRLVASGHGLAVVPDFAAVSAAGIRVVPVTEPRLVHRVELMHRPEPGPVVVALVDLLRGKAT